MNMALRGGQGCQYDTVKGTDAGPREMWEWGWWLVGANNCPLKAIASTMRPTHREGAPDPGEDLTQAATFEEGIFVSSISLLHLTAKPLPITQGNPWGHL